MLNGHLSISAEKRRFIRRQIRQFAELAEHETEGEDYQIEYTDMGTELLILSPHGGGIEGGVSELVRAFSADYSTYLFEGIKPSQTGISTSQAII
ncbi:poly-gamma-glutamate hydrolase family protein [Bacillus licheniformis]|nr:poly-gamma-glutamate hydrolase family protein [Bacillus licheniformis]